MIAHGVIWQYMKRPQFWGHDLHNLELREVIGHVTILLAMYGLV